MGREVRRVPKDWQHPMEPGGRYTPLHGGSVSALQAEWDEEAAQWEAGFMRSWEKDGPRFVPKEDRECSFEEWHGKRPLAEDYMPDWPEAERTHYQMYEDTSEGTPISPVMESPEALARWLADNRASAFAGEGASYEHWLAMIKGGGWAPSGIMTGGRMMSGVEGMAVIKAED